MRKISIILFISGFLLFGSLAGFSQGEKKYMTNAEVIELVRAGFDESTILLAIEQSDPNFDTSSNALLELEELGISEEIIRAMQKLECIAPVMPDPNGDPLQTGTNEVILRDGEKRILMKRSPVNNRFIRGDLIFIFYNRTDMVFAGKQSQLRVNDSTPEFEASLPSDVDAADLLKLVKLKRRSDQREIKIEKNSNSNSGEGLSEKAIIPTTFEEVRTVIVGNGKKYTLYRIRVKNPLAPGEYAFVPRKYELEYYYDFGIDK